MDWKMLGLVFSTVFLAELGDKTQLATLLFSARQPSALLTVFLGASLALVAATAIAVVAGHALSQFVDFRYLSWLAGAGFIVIGIWTIWTA